jgi:hypothetical protein
MHYEDVRSTAAAMVARVQEVDAWKKVTEIKINAA